MGNIIMRLVLLAEVRQDYPSKSDTFLLLRVAACLVRAFTIRASFLGSSVRAAMPVREREVPPHVKRRHRLIAPVEARFADEG